MQRYVCERALAFAVVASALFGSAARAANQTSSLSPVVIGGALSFHTQIAAPVSFAALPTLHSFSRASFFNEAVGHSQWLIVGGMTNGMHDLTGSTGFDPASHNKNLYVVDPITQQVWSRSINDAAAALTATEIETLSTTNSQYTQLGSHLYITGGYGPMAATSDYGTYATLTSIDLPGMIDWVKGGAGTAASRIRQIEDPIFQVTGGEMATTSNGRTHLVFGQNYPSSYEPRFTGDYTKQVRSFTIVDNAAGLSIADPVVHAAQEDFRRRDLNVVPIIREEGGAYVDKLQALAGVFTPSFGAWTVPVTIDENGNATQPDPTAAGTFKQGMNGYRSATLGLYSAKSDQMHTLLLGGISYQYFDPATGQVLDDFNLPFTSDSTVVVTDADGTMTQYLLPQTYPDLISVITGQPLLLGAETEFFLKDGIATYANGVIDLDALTGPTLVGWLYGGIAAEQPNNGATVASNAMFPVIITPVPEPTLVVGALGLSLIATRRRRGIA